MHDRPVEKYIIDAKYLKMFFSLATLARNILEVYILFTKQCMRDKLKMPHLMSNICKFSARSLCSLVIEFYTLFDWQCMTDMLKMPLSMSNICKFSARSQ